MTFYPFKLEHPGVVFSVSETSPPAMAASQFPIPMDRASIAGNLHKLSGNRQPLANLRVASSLKSALTCRPAQMPISCTAGAVTLATPADSAAH